MLRSPFAFPDTASARQGTTDLAAKLKHERVAIVGLGGTGSYVLDFVSKTWVTEILLFDGDLFLNHNAFRAPGAYSIEELSTAGAKANLHGGRYAKMRRGVAAFPQHIDDTNVHQLVDCDTVFVCVDGGKIKRLILDTCLPNGILVIDCGMDVKRAEVDRLLLATIRVTAFPDGVGDHAKTCIDLEDGGDDEYQRNAQMAELNALNAALAVIKWKKLRGIYRDDEGELNSEFILDWHRIHNSYAPT